MHVVRWRPSRTCLIGVAGTVLLIASGLIGLQGRSVEAAQDATVGGGQHSGQQAVSVTQQQSMGQCSLHTSHSHTGPGCCDREPAACGGFTYTYDARCSGFCPSPLQWCWPSGVESDVLVYYQQPCSGDCSFPNPPVNSCGRGDPVIQRQVMPTSCACYPPDDGIPTEPES